MRWLVEDGKVADIPGLRMSGENALGSSTRGSAAVYLEPGWLQPPPPDVQTLADLTWLLWSQVVNLILPVLDQQVLIERVFGNIHPPIFTAQISVQRKAIRARLSANPCKWLVEADGTGVVAPFPSLERGIDVDQVAFLRRDLAIVPSLERAVLVGESSPQFS